MEIKKETIIAKKKWLYIKYIKRISRIIVSSLIGFTFGLGMAVLYVAWSMNFIPEISYSDTTSLFPIVTISLQAIFILGAEFVSGFISTTIRKAIITGIIVSATLGSIIIILNLFQGIINIIIIIVGNYLGGYFAENKY